MGLLANRDCIAVSSLAFYCFVELYGRARERAAPEGGLVYGLR
jgi:hypothetical protein